MRLLEVTHLRKTFGNLIAVDDISFEVRTGEIFGLLGPNGAGKSTTMMMLTGLIVPDAGTIELNGQIIEPNNRRARTCLGVVPQDLAIYPELTARENLQFFGRLYGVRGVQLKKRVNQTLERIGLTDRADDLTRTFSGGMKRRLNFGAALIHEPRLLILDEPTVGVDPHSRSHLLDCIRELSSEGIACIYASHYMEEVQALCQRVAIIDHGRMLACDALTSLLGQLSSDLCLRISHPSNELAQKLKSLAEIVPPSNGELNTKLIVSRDQQADEKQLGATLRKVVEMLDQNGATLHSIETHEPNLERLFLQMTGSKLRD